MFGNQRFRITRRFLQRRQSTLIPDISKGDADIPEHTAAFGSQQGRSSESRLESAIIQGK